MPSPIAHAAVALLAAPALGECPTAEPRWRTLAVMLLVVFACGAPDLDIIAGWLLIQDGFTYHGAYSHSLLLAPVFGLPFAVALRWLRPDLSLSRSFLVGTLLYAAHVVLDTLIHDTRGVSLLWPLLPDRYASPIIIFVGVEYGEWWRWDMHLLTVLNESAFAVLVLWFSKLVFRSRSQPGGIAHAAS
ncbi:MAG: metal-dependent hydrolase [Planctomycetota bacterium]